MATSEPIQMYHPEATDLKLWRQPEQILVEAQQAAEALQKRIKGKAKPVIFNNEQYIEADDWEMLAHFYGYVAKVESTDFVQYGETSGFKASAVLLNEHTGLVVSRAEAVCLDEEENWGPRPKYEWRELLGLDNKPIWDKDKGRYRKERVQVGEVDTPLFQILSMAQTRACAKVTRNKLAWVVTLAGYKPTPAEEIDSTTPLEEATPAAAPLPTELKRKEPQAASAPTAPKPPLTPQSAAPRPPIQSPKPANVRVISEAQGRRFYAIWKQNGRTQDQVTEYLQSVCGVKSDRDMPAHLYEAACKWAEGF